MRKKSLLNTRPLTATAKMLKMAAEDKGELKSAKVFRGSYSYTQYRTGCYFRAVCREGNILEVDMFTRADLAKKDREPRFRIFLDYENKEDNTYDCVSGKWRKAKIDGLDWKECQNALYVPQGKSIQTDTVRRLVNTYFHTGLSDSVWKAVLDFQNAVRADSLSKRHRIITDWIDQDMDMVPELPKNFDRFVHRKGFGDNHMLFFDNGSSKGYCTACMRHVPLKGRQENNVKGRCPQCGSSVTYKGWKRQKYADGITRVSILQKCEDGVHYVYRQFEARRKMHREQGYVPELKLYEEYRLILDARMREHHEYEFGEFKNTGISRWCESGTARHGGYGYYYGCYAKSVLYSANLTRLLKDTGLKYIPVAEIVRAVGSRRLDVRRMLDNMVSGRLPYEAFWKMGLKRFVMDDLLDSGWLTKLRCDAERRKPWECIGLSKEYFNQAVRMDAGDRMVRILQRFRDIEVRVTDEQLEWIDGYIGPHVLLEYFCYQTPHKIIRYLREKLGVGEDMEHAKSTMSLYADYLDAARKLGMDIGDASVFFPQDMKRAHDEAAEQYTMMQEQEEASKRKESDAKLKKRAKLLKKLFDYGNERMLIVIPDSWLALKREGNAQHNCVTQYYDRAVEGETNILFIRRKEEPGKAFCTVEVKECSGRMHIIQNRIIYNGEAPKEAKDFMEKALARAQEKADRSARDRERENPVRIPVAM